MKPLTYRELLAALQELSNDQLDMSVTVYASDECEAYPVLDTFVVSEMHESIQDELDGVLEGEQPVLVI